MNKPLWVGAAALALASSGLLAVPSAAAPSSNVAVVSIAVAGDQATISQSTIRPGVVEFRVGDTFEIPGPDGGPDQLTIVRTDHLDQVLAALPLVFAANPDDPASFATAAAAMRTIHAASTMYGGGQKGTVWQVKLAPGDYYAVGIPSAAMGLAKPVPFTVAGDARPGIIHETQATLRAVGPVGANRWTFQQRGRSDVEWLRFTNAAHEIHFAGMSAVKPSTTDAMVKRTFAGQGQEPPRWMVGPALSFDVISPGVSVAVKGPLPAGRYLVDCFVPSESDGMPHALMGMWKLFEVR